MVDGSAVCCYGGEEGTSHAIVLFIQKVMYLYFSFHLFLIAVIIVLIMEEEGENGNKKN